jgi:hypothetical protein
VCVNFKPVKSVCFNKVKLLYGFFKHFFETTQKYFHKNTQKMIQAYCPRKLKIDLRILNKEQEDVEERRKKIQKAIYSPAHKRSREIKDRRNEFFFAFHFDYYFNSRLVISEEKNSPFDFVCAEANDGKIFFPCLPHLHLQRRQHM